MTQSPGFDPVSTWQDMLQKWEQEINSWSGKITQTEQFAAVMGQATKISMVAQKAMGDQMESTLKSLNLPTKSQLDTIIERLDSIEESIDRLRLELAKSGGGSAEPTPAPSRTRKPAQG
jgi:SMC interacting uncharacterized protein involved in chromosome segregation